MKRQRTSSRLRKPAWAMIASLFIASTLVFAPAPLFEAMANRSSAGEHEESIAPEPIATNLAATGQGENESNGADATAPSESDRTSSEGTTGAEAQWSASSREAEAADEGTGSSGGSVGRESHVSDSWAAAPESLEDFAGVAHSRRTAEPNDGNDEGKESFDQRPFRYRLVVGFDGEPALRDGDTPIGSGGDAVLIGFEDEDSLAEGLAYYSDVARFASIDGTFSISGNASGDLRLCGEEIASGRDPLTALEALDVEPTGPSGDKPLIAIIDTGCPADLCEKAVSMIDEDPGDGDGHGSDMARLVLGQDPDAMILSIKALDASGLGSVSSIYAAIRYAIDSGADIVSMSFSAYAPDGCAAIESLVEEASARGIAIVVSAGNDGANAASYCPAQIRDAICVGALGPDGNPAAQSNFGEMVDVWAPADSTSIAAAIMVGRMSKAGRPANGSWLASLLDSVDVVRVEPNAPDKKAPTPDDAISHGAAELIGSGAGALFATDFSHAAITSRTHISNVGDSNWMTTNADKPAATANTTMTSSSYGIYVSSLWWESGRGPYQHIENLAFKVASNNAPSGGITYRCYFQNVGYDSWRSNGTYSPSAIGKGLCVEGFEAKLTGTLASCYNLNYKVFTSLYQESNKSKEVRGASRSFVHTWFSASNGGYAGTMGKGVAIEGYRMWLTPKSYTHTVQVRYQNANGSWGNYANARSGSYAYASTVPAWNRAADATYNAGGIAAYTAGYAATTKQVSISRKSYATTWNGNGGTSPAPVSRLAGAPVGNLPSTTRTGYTFSGWYTAATGGTAITPTTATPSAAVAYYAHWNPNTYSVTFDANGGSGNMETKTMTYDQAAQLPACGFTQPESDRLMVFEGWNTKPDGSGDSFAAGQTVKNLSADPGASVVLYAQWIPAAMLPAAGTTSWSAIAICSATLALVGALAIIAQTKEAIVRRRLRMVGSDRASNLTPHRTQPRHTAVGQLPRGSVSDALSHLQRLISER